MIGRSITDGKILRAFSGVVEGIYAAALEPIRWQEAMKGIADLHGCPAAHLLTPTTAPTNGGFIFSHGLSAADLDLWASKYVHHDPWVKAATEQGRWRDGFVFVSEDVLPRKELEKTIFYKEYLTRIGVGGFCAGVVFSGTHPGLIPTSCSFFNDLTAPPFTDRDKKLHSLTVTHLSRALGTMFRLRDAELRIAANVSALDKLATGTLLFGEQGQVVFANRAALDIVRRGDGPSLRVGNPMRDGLGRLSAAHADDEREISKAISDAVSMEKFPDTHFSRGVLIRHTNERRPYLLQISPLPLDNELSGQSQSAFGIGFLMELGSIPRLDAKELAQAFDLSPAECVLAQELLSGDALESIGARLSIGENTVKTQLQSIYEKTNTHRQSALVRLLMGLASQRREGTDRN